jgi:hypothetical protein
MMKRIFTLANLRLVIEIVLIGVLVPVAFSRQASTRAAAPQEPEAPDALYWYQCNAPNHVGLFIDRVHIYCGSTTPISNAPQLSSAIHWFAVPTAPDSAQASRFMSLLQTSVITAKPIWMQVNPNDTSGASYGCGAGDCRRIYGMEMR